MIKTISLRINEDLRSQLESLAKSQDYSINTCLIKMIKKELQRKKLNNENEKR